jgi:predicted phosphoadenosine phosphosulfate sulfurtransferase
MTVRYPNSITLILKSNNNSYEEYKIKVWNFIIHPKYLERYDSHYGHRVAVGIGDLSKASPFIEDLQDYKEHLLNTMPKLTKKYRHKKGDFIKISMYHSLSAY